MLGTDSGLGTEKVGKFPGALGAEAARGRILLLSSYPRPAWKIPFSMMMGVMMMTVTILYSNMVTHPRPRVIPCVFSMIKTLVSHK